MEDIIAPPTRRRRGADTGSAPRPRGLAALSPEKRREIARLGGVASHKAGTGHVWTSKEAIAAGRKGGRNSNGGKGKNYEP